jgi:hypothetical protein
MIVHVMHKMEYTKVKVKVEPLEQLFELYKKVRAIYYEIFMGRDLDVQRLLGAFLLASDADHLDLMLASMNDDYEKDHCLDDYLNACSQLHELYVTERSKYVSR